MKRPHVEPVRKDRLVQAAICQDGVTYCIPPWGALTPGGKLRLLLRRKSLVPRTRRLTSDSPVARMEPVSLSLGVLNLDRKTHHYSSTQRDGSVDEFDTAELDITNTTKLLV